MEPNKDGKIDFGNVQKVFNQYRAVLSQMPGFTEKKFDEVVQTIQSQLFKAAEVPAKFRDLFTHNIAGLVKGADKVFADVSSDAQTRIAALANATGKELRGAMAEQAKLLRAQLEAAKQYDPTPFQMRSLAQLRDAAIDAFRKIEGAEGEAREQAIKDAMAMQQAFDKALADIGKKGAAAFGRIDKGEKKVAADAHKAAAAAAAERRARLAGIPAEQQPAADPQAGQQNAQQGKQPQGPNLAGDSPGARRARIAQNNQAAAAQPTLFQQVGGMANQINGMLTNAVTGAMNMLGQGQAALQQVMTKMSPLQKLTTQIAGAQAQLSMAQINHADAGILQQMQTELSGLQHRRQRAQAQMLGERRRAVMQAERSKRQDDIQRQTEQQGGQQALNDNLSNLVLVGRRAAMSPVQITIEGVNDIRQAVDKIQVELKRRGWLPGHKNTLETRKMW
jgi:hypothetical protein